MLIFSTQSGSNNYVELLVLNFLLNIIVEHNVSLLQVLGGSMVKISWMKGIYQMGKYVLIAMFEKVSRIVKEKLFFHICISTCN